MTGKRILQSIAHNTAIALACTDGYLIAADLATGNWVQLAAHLLVVPVLVVANVRTREVAQ